MTPAGNTRSLAYTQPSCILYPRRVRKTRSIYRMSYFFVFIYFCIFYPPKSRLADCLPVVADPSLRVKSPSRGTQKWPVPGHLILIRSGSNASPRAVMFVYCFVDFDGKPYRQYNNIFHTISCQRFIMGHKKQKQKKGSKKRKKVKKEGNF